MGGTGLWAILGPWGRGDSGAAKEGVANTVLKSKGQVSVGPAYIGVRISAWP